MRRLFSSFARGWPGVGLLLLRLVAAIALIPQGVARPEPGASIQANLLALATAGSAALLLAGLWTPIAGATVTIVESWSTFSEPGDPWARILLGTIGAALALLGPGVWSVDARLFGWKRIDLRNRNN